MYIEKISRSTRVAAQIKKEMTNVLRGPKFAAKYSTINISRVDVSKDLKNAKIFYTSFADIIESCDEDCADLNHDITQIRYQLAQNIKMKYVPRISFSHDKELLAERRVNDILDSVSTNTDE